MDMGGLYNNTKLAEVLFKVEDHELPAHLAILSVRCPCLLAEIKKQHKDYFDGKGQLRFSSGLDGDDGALPLIVKLDDIRYPVFRQLLVYIYTGALPFDPGMGVELRRSADRFQLEECKKLSAQQIKQNVTDENVLTVLQVAHECGEQYVKNFCKQFIAKQYDKIALSDQVKLLPPDLLVEVLRIPTLRFKNKSNEVSWVAALVSAPSF